MRLAIIAPLALAAVVGLSTAAAACPVDNVTGPITDILNTVTNVLGLTSPTTPTTTDVVSTVDTTCTACSACGSTPTGSSGPTGPTTSGACSKAKGLLTNTASALTSPDGSITNNFITNNFITNDTTTTTAADGATPAATGTTTAATGPFALTAGTGGGGGGVGGGGGGLGGGGFGGSNTGISGMPINPSSDLAAFVVPMSAGGGMGGTTFNELAAGGGGDGGQTSDVNFAMASPGTDGPLTAGVTLASLPASQGGDEPFVGMASPKAGPGSAVAATSPFGFDGPASAADGPPPGADYGALMLAGLVGVGVLGAGWAWKSLVV